MCEFKNVVNYYTQIMNNSPFSFEYIYIHYKLRQLTCLYTSGWYEPNEKNIYHEKNQQFEIRNSSPPSHPNFVAVIAS